MAPKSVSGALLGRSGDHHGPKSQQDLHKSRFWAPFWSQVGPSWDQVGPSWGQVGPSWVQVGRTLSQIGTKLGQVEPKLEQNGPTCEPKQKHQKTLIFQRFFNVFGGSGGLELEPSWSCWDIFSPSWLSVGGLGSNLGPSWAS